MSPQSGLNTSTVKLGNKGSGYNKCIIIMSKYFTLTILDFDELPVITLTEVIKDFLKSFDFSYNTVQIGYNKLQRTVNFCSSLSLHRYKHYMVSK